jgi:hypothetical protein
LVPQVITGLASSFKHFGKLEPGGEPPGPETYSMIAATMPAPPSLFAVGAFRHDGSIITR